MTSCPLCLGVLAPWPSYSWSPSWTFFQSGIRICINVAITSLIHFFFHNIGNITLSRMLVLCKAIKWKQSLAVLWQNLLDFFWNLFFPPADIMIYGLTARHSVKILSDFHKIVGRTCLSYFCMQWYPVHCMSSGSVQKFLLQQTSLSVRWCTNQKPKDKILS